MALKVYTSGNYIITDTGTVMHEFAKGYTTYSYNQSTQTFTIRESVGGSFTVTRAQLLAGDIVDEAESAYTFNSFRTFLRENTGFKTASGGSGASYKVYTALLTQSGTDAPVATVLDNTIGNIVWTRNDIGQYLGTLSMAFPQNQTFYQTAIISKSSNGSAVEMMWNDVDSLTVQTQSSNLDTDDFLNYTPIEIRVYN